MGGQGHRLRGEVGRRFRADGFKHAMAWAEDGAKPAAVPAGRHRGPRGAAVGGAAAGRGFASGRSRDGGRRGRFCRLPRPHRPGRDRRRPRGRGLRRLQRVSGALGRYQLTPEALRDPGWKDAGGGWTTLAARHGIASDADFLGIR